MSSRPRAGFSLVELAVVLFVVSVAISILLPRLPGLESSRRDAALRRISGAVQALHEEALFKKKA
ncbi:MAG: prepilin-type N-terminal cleavage/methylation domain-containing protein [Deferrisomatales bacterium]|nr:prepilin-type N-terminal cleavage/methylation domain-containing protein [Deferrisomatales bacterium]